jgi:hypothetical protein
MSALVGVGTLALQFWASRVLFPKMGVSFAALLHAGLLSLAAGGVAVAGGIFALAGLQALDDILQFSLQKPVEQVSLLPFTGPRKSAALATLGGVLRPASKAAAGALALLLAGNQGMLPIATVGAAVLAFLAYTRHRPRYLSALEGALVRHTVDFQVDTPLVQDRGALDAIDRGLEDEDATVVVFAVSLLPQLPEADALPRVIEHLHHPEAEVRAEAALVLGQMDLSDLAAPEKALRGHLRREVVPFVLSSLLRTAGEMGGIVPRDVQRFLSHEDGRVRTEALIALGRMGWPELGLRLRGDLRARDATARSAAARAVGKLGLTDLMEEVATGVEDPETRPAALAALSELGEPAVPVLAELLRRRDLPLPSRRSVITALASIDAPAARSVLLGMIVEPALGPAALTCLHRMRKTRRLDPVNPARFRPTLDAEIRKGLRYALMSSAIRANGDGQREAFVAGELEGLRMRALVRVLRILALCYEPAHLTAVEAGLQAADRARRSNALELLEGTIDPSVARSVMPFAEATSEGFAVDPATSILKEAPRLLERPLESLAEEAEWWPRALALYALHRDDEITTPGRSPDDEETREAEMIPLIEKVMILKGSQLFASFPGNDLAGIASLADVVHLRPGDVVFRQGEVGDAFYMVVRGTVRITRGSTELALLGPRQGFGELAILDDEARSATATAAEATTLLRIDRHSFDRLIDQNPAVARGIYRTLSRRLRTMLAQVAAG